MKGGELVRVTESFFENFSIKVDLSGSVGNKARSRSSRSTLFQILRTVALTAGNCPNTVPSSNFLQCYSEMLLTLPWAAATRPRALSSN